MPQCFCSYNPPSTSTSNLISNPTLHSPHFHKIKDPTKIHPLFIKTGLTHHTVSINRVLALSSTGPARNLNYALSIFHRIQNPNLFSWNTIIRGFCQSSSPHVAILLFIQMLSGSIRPEELTYPSVFKAYTYLGLAEDGAQLHGRVIKLGLEFDPYVRNSIIHMYASCGLLGNARKLFDEMRDSDVVAWNSMVMGYAKSGDVGESFRLFGEMPVRNEVSWNSMISGFVRNGRWVEALGLFNEMQERGIKLSEFTLVSALNACAKLGAFEQGKWIHEYVIRNESIELNVIVVTAIIDMYCKCGDVENALRVFEGYPRKGLSCWNSMMMGLATNGCEEEAFELFSKLESSNLTPDSVTFIGVLTASNHSLRVDKARKYLKMMKETYGIEPRIEHCGCMVDVLGRAGLIEEAVEFIKSMPMSPDAVIWGSLLSACSHHRNVDVAKWASRNLSLSDPSDTSAHVLLSNVYAASGDFKKAVEERMKMKNEKQRGCSSIEVNGEIHEFLAGGNWHSQMQVSIERFECLEFMINLC